MQAYLKKIKVIKEGIILILFFFLFSSNSIAQFYNGSQTNFGKNRVQYNNHFWSFYRFEKFDTYFYTNGPELAAFTAQYANKTIRQIEHKLDYPMDGKIQFVVFNKLSDLKQSNIGMMNESEYNIGGITHIVGSKVFVYFDGSHVNLQRQIRAGIANVIMDQMMFGGRITAMMKNSALLSLPDWYSKGLVSYMSEDWDTEIDNHVKDGILRGDYKKFSGLSGMEAVYAGHSIWRFIADKYGPSTIANIVYMTKVSKNVESGFLFVLGISYKDLVREWLSYYETMYAPVENEIIDNTSAPLIHRVKKAVVYQQLKICPDGTLAAYATNDMGRWKVRLYDMQTKKSKTILKAGQKLDEKTDYSSPLLAWHPSGKLLSIIFERKGEIFMYYYTLEDHKFEKQKLFNIEKVLDYSFAQNGKMMVMSAVVNGQSDIYVYNLASHTYETITKDIWDDLNPQFIKNSSEIIFSSNRPDDTIRYDIQTNFITASDTISEVPSSFDLYIYDYESDNLVMRRVTNSPASDELSAMEYDKRHFTYLSNENGIVNRYVARVDSTISFVDTTTHYRYYTTSYPVTNYSRSIIEQDVNRSAKKIAEIIFRNNRYHMYVDDLAPTKELKPLKLKNTYFMDKYILELEQKKTDTISSTLSPEELEYIQQKKDKHKNNRRTTNVLIDEMNHETDTSKVDINNYRFGTPANDSIVESDTNDKKIKNSFEIPRAENYNVEYFINQLVTQLDFDFLNTTYQPYSGGSIPVYMNPGFNALFKLGVIDLMEDYRISGGFRLALDLDNNEFFISFDNFKKRLDKTLVIHRQAMENATDYSLIKIRSHDIQYVVKWPFSNTLAFRGSGILRWDKTIYAATDIINLQQPNINNYWAGIKAELIFDNTRPRGINIFYGTRWKVFGEYYERITDKMDYLVVLGLDYRHYQKIHKTFIWANRIAASTSFGSSPLVYYLGGVDNWLIPKFNNDITVNQTKNYGFQTLATNMRGFTQNIRNGNNFALINSELRFPIFRYFSKKPIKSEFFSNFQIVGFGDLGMAWTGWNPWSEENTIFKDVYTQGPITVTIRNERDPIVGGMGVGLRTRILGYFVRVDYAWGIENLKIQKPLIYLSLSTDF
jgi:hypothetical protein